MQLVVRRIVVVVDELAFGIELLVQLRDHFIEIHTATWRRLVDLPVIRRDHRDAAAGTGFPVDQRQVCGDLFVELGERGRLLFRVGPMRVRGVIGAFHVHEDQIGDVIGADS